MEVPKTFKPKGDLKEKLECLLEGPRPRQTLEERAQVYQEAKEKFPKLIEYLLELYSELEVIKRAKEETGWYFWNNEKFIGVINNYCKYNGESFLSEIGYQGDIYIKGKWLWLKYREGYVSPNGSNDVVCAFSPHRFDDADEVPFP